MSYQSMTVGHSFSTKLEIFKVQSFSTKLEIFEMQSFLLDVIIGKRLQLRKLHFSLTKTKVSISSPAQ